jgi:hypothetical protein
MGGYTEISRAELLDTAARAVRTGSGYWRAHCPFCEASEGLAQSKRNFTIRMSSGEYWCWKCAEKGRIQNVSEAMSWAVEEARAEEVETALLQGKYVESSFPAPEGFTLIGEGYGLTANRFSEAREYIIGRGVSLSTVADCEIGAVLSGKYRRSVVVPVLDRGRWRGYVCRRYDRKGYLYPRGMQRGSVMFNMDALTEDSDEPIMLVEGCFDALPHYPVAVACLGKPSAAHYEMLKKVRRPLAIVLDADAQREGWALAQMLQLDGVNASYVKLRPGSDPGDTDPEWLLEEVYRSFD